MLQEILDNHVPPNWKSSSYSTSRYVLVDLEDSDHEYQQVVAAFKDMEVARVVRVQNPFIYGRFKIRKEYLGLSKSVNETTKYHPVLAADVDEVATHNCDPRRYQDSNYAQHAGKNPRFYETPNEAFKEFCTRNHIDAFAIVVVKVLDEDCCGDSHYCPEYSVYLQ